MWHKTVVLSVVFSLAAGLCASEFPLCMYGVNDPEDLATIKKAGFSCFQTYNQDPARLEKLALEAQKQGLKTVFYPDKIIGSEYEQKARTWPVLAWYLVDEPDVWSWPRERVIKHYDKAKKAFPAHLLTLVIGQGKTAIPYYDLPDTLMVDWYPVPHLPLVSFGEQLSLAQAGLQNAGMPEKPLWGVVQIFNWKEFKQHRPDNDRVGRFPTEDEIRFMSYHGILNGASGLFYFLFTSNGKPLPQAQPEWWNRVAAVSRELAAFKPVLEGGKPVKNPAVSVAPLIQKSWKYKGNKYTVLLNASDAALPLPKKLLKKKYKSLFGREKAAQLSPYQVLVFSY